MVRYSKPLVASVKQRMVDKSRRIVDFLNNDT